MSFVWRTKQFRSSRCRFQGYNLPCVSLNIISIVISLRACLRCSHFHLHVWSVSYNVIHMPMYVDSIVEVCYCVNILESNCIKSSNDVKVRKEPKPAWRSLRFWQSVRNYGYEMEYLKLKIKNWLSMSHTATETTSYLHVPLKLNVKFLKLAGIVFLPTIFTPPNSYSMSESLIRHFWCKSWDVTIILNIPLKVIASIFRKLCEKLKISCPLIAPCPRCYGAQTLWLGVEKLKAYRSELDQPGLDVIIMPHTWQTT